MACLVRKYNMSRIKQKQQANVVSPNSVSPQVSQGSKKSFEDDMREAMNDWNGEM